MFFAIAGTFLWAWGNIFDKRLMTRHLKDPVILTALFSFPSLVFSGLLLAFIGIPSVSGWVAFAAFSAGVVLTFALIPYFRALASEEASRVVPLWHFSPLFTLVLAVVFLGEVLTWSGYVAFALILAGGFLVSTRRIGDAFHLSHAMVLMLLSSFLFAVSDVLLKFAYSNNDGFWGVFLLTSFGATLGHFSLFVMPGVRGSFSKAVSNGGAAFFSLLALSSVTGIFGNLLWNLALLSGPVTLVSAFISFHSFFVLALTTGISVRFPSFLKESIEPRTIGVKAVAIALMASGLWMLSAR
ncbi:EamA family transporter [Candidatus Woesearchaeota archaeon]|nr:EamA family transporter [Candidatus Woesearchaeota archaeon]